MAIIRFHGGDCGGSDVIVRCGLGASDPVQLWGEDGGGWLSTPYQGADARQSYAGLLRIGRRIAAEACEMPADEFTCDHEDVRCECGCCDDCDGEPSVYEEGVWLCDECSDQTWTDDGEGVCSRMTRGWKRCHVCEERIRWGRIETGSGGPNHMRGSCDCGEAWYQEERGGQWVYSYAVPESVED